MNNKPVAWIEPNVIPLTHIIKAVVRREQDEQYSIPLYTHPVKEPMMVLDGNRVYPVFKELTDEKIHKIWDEVMQTRGQGNDLNKFARAILRKAQEK